ncbi:MAG: NADH-quinone oxidoreductase subunit NuoG [Alphaproteobacteria bacterium]|nr:NADH-quinone oxidoreductase subunit NuoG [Alphaproteobacteria bacterium]
MPKLTIDGIMVDVPPGATVMQACELAGKEIPRFCYHERLSIAGNCRMCLVEQEKSPKPIASCAMPAAEGMVIHTDTPMVKKARHGVMEFLLINHPLDCPICDQGGECDLQDQAMAYGYDRSRFIENKRAVPDKNLGPIIKTYMNRCIHCTRCVRFADEVAGVPELGAFGRGEHMEVGTYVEAALTSELSGNLVDLCPVGALTAKPYAFIARPWELKKTASIDVMDAVGSHIRVDARGEEVLRILPRASEAINEEWISDKTRHATDGLSHRRLDRPWLRDAHGELKPSDWESVLSLLAEKIKKSAPQRMAALVGDLVDCEQIFALKSLMVKMGVANIDGRGDEIGLGGEKGAVGAAGWRFNSGFAGIDHADALLLIGTNPRLEASVLNARIRKRYLKGHFPIAFIGEQPKSSHDLTYRYNYLGIDVAAINVLLSAKEGFAARLAAAERPMVIIGSHIFAHGGAELRKKLMELVEKFSIVRENWNGYNILHHAASRVGALELGFVPSEGGHNNAGILAAAAAGEIDVLWLAGVDHYHRTQFGHSFVVYQGHHGDRGAEAADVILPGSAYTEKNAIYVNSEGRPQAALRAVFPPGDAREDWKIIRALAGKMGLDLGFDTIEELRAAMAKSAPIFNNLGSVTAANWQDYRELVKGETATAISEENHSVAHFSAAIADFYRTCPISRASPTLQKCSQLFVQGQTIEDKMEAEAVYG